MVCRMTQDSTMQLRIAQKYRGMLDELRRSEPDLPSRSEMMRRLIERAAQKSEGARRHADR
jgi:preprotein translocase subunit SecA